MRISVKDGEVVYEARVPNQNDGKAIPFVLNPPIRDTISSENPAHDFPQRIQYVPIRSDHVLVGVLGGDGKGFSYAMYKNDL